MGMKKSCKGCYAAITGQHPLSGEPYGCELGYQTDGFGHPKDECPKPKSWNAVKSAEKMKKSPPCGRE
jgi:hypothetical protein